MGQNAFMLSSMPDLGSPRCDSTRRASAADALAPDPQIAITSTIRPFADKHPSEA